MKDGKLTRQGIEELRQNYPPGTRIELIHMDDKWAVAKGTRGTVTQVDDAGTIHMKWDNGRTLGLVPQADQVRKLTEQEQLEEQTQGQEQILKMQ